MVLRSLRVLASAAVFAGLVSAATASAQARQSGYESTNSRVELYLGYGYFNPLDSNINGYKYPVIYNPNVTANLTYFFSQHFGAQLEGSYFNDNRTQVAGVSTICALDASLKRRCEQDENVLAFQAGPVFRYPIGRLVPFAHVLGGGLRMNGPVVNPLTTGWGVTGGLGADITLPFFHELIAVRAIQADVMGGHIIYNKLVLPAGIVGGAADILAIRLSAGLVFRFGHIESTEKRALELGCTAEPTTVLPGEPVTVSGSALYLNPRRNAAYTWTTSGGRLAPSGSAVTIDTAGLAPGEYVVSGRLSDGPRAGQQASCSAPFTVHSPAPPTVSCTATPISGPSGTTFAITAAGMSPQNRPLTYSFTASSGQITSSGTSATLNTTGVTQSPILVTCNAVDDQGKTATNTAQVTIESAAVASTASSATPSSNVPPIATTQTLCTLDFARDRARPARVNNESKACLDDIALTLNRQTDGQLVLVGNTSSNEKPELAAERVLNVRQYLVAEKGIDRSRIELRVGDTSGRTVNTTLVPAGATFTNANTQTFDESTIPRHGQAYAGGTASTATPATRKRKRARHRTAVAAAAAAPAVQ